MRWNKPEQILTAVGPTTRRQRAFSERLLEKNMQACIKQLFCTKLSIMMLAIILFCMCIPDHYQALRVAIN